MYVGKSMVCECPCVWAGVHVRGVQCGCLVIIVIGLLWELSQRKTHSHVIACTLETTCSYILHLHVYVLTPPATCTCINTHLMVLFLNWFNHFVLRLFACVHSAPNILYMSSCIFIRHLHRKKKFFCIAPRKRFHTKLITFNYICTHNRKINQCAMCTV